MSIVKLQSSDGEIFDVETNVAKCSNTIKTMLDHLDVGEDDGQVIPLPNVRAAILQKILQWATYHKDDHPITPLDEETRERRTDDICEWDRNFLLVHQSTLFELMLAANYLDIRGLLDATCKTVANMIKGKMPTEIRKTFNIVNDLTPEEEQRIRRENEWCEEK